MDLPVVRVGAEHDDGNCLGGRIVAESLKHLVAVDVGQVEVQQHDDGLAVAGHLEAQESFCGGDEFDAGSVGEQPLEEAQVRRVVLDVEHDVACGGGDDGVWQRILHIIPVG